MSTQVAMTVRPFRDDDFGPVARMGTAAFPDEPWSEAEMRHADAGWDHGRFEMVRVIAEDAQGSVVGYGRFNHMPWQFHPRKYALWLLVDPARRRQGIGGALYAHVLDALRARQATTVRTFVGNETEIASVAFLTRRGFVEVQRGWESRLDVGAFDFSRFAGAAERVAQQGIVITTLAALRARDPEAVRAAYDLFVEAGSDTPAVDPVTPEPFGQWVATNVESPKALLDAFFVAVASGQSVSASGSGERSGRAGGGFDPMHAPDGDRYVGLSQLHRRLEQPDVLQQELTAVRREYRGRGIAMALKLHTVAYARAHGYREIRTGNDIRNRPMLRINEALGFVKQPAWIGFEKTLAGGA